MLVVAHQGGWDEMIFVVAPIALFAGLLVIANRRANKHARERQRGLGDEPEHPRPF